jgi:hypothetical protein
MTLLTQFFSEGLDAFQQAEQTQPRVEHRLCVAGRCFRLCFAGLALVPAILPALAHLKTDLEHALPDITFCLWDAASTGVYPPRPPFSDQDYHRYGRRAVRDDGERAILYAPAIQLLSAYDRAARLGFFWTRAADDLSIYERAAPLQTLFHWALKNSGWQILHAAAVGNERGGVLLVGNTSAGKSTTALACLEIKSLHYLSDDKCLVSLEPAPRAFGVFSSAKLKADMLDRLPHFKPLVAGWDDAYKVGKSLVYLYPAYRKQMVTAFPIKAILVSRITHQAEPALTLASPSEVLRVLGPSTVIWLPGAEADSLRFTADLAKRAPCYTLDLARNPADNLNLIAQVLARHL